MSEALEDRHGGIGGEQQPSRAVNVFQSWWLQSFGYALAALYLFYFVILYRAGSWIVDGAGSPIYTDFACAWTAALQAISGHAASLYDPSKFVEMQAAVVGPSDYFYPNWPYPPTFLLILAPFAALGYLHAFVVWDLLTLLGCVAVVYSIVRRRAAIAMALAAPFTAWNLVAAQNGFLTASLLGASLLFLERQPVLAGVFIGCLTYKPQFGILFPVALLAARQWRAIASCTIVVAVLAGAAVAAFGTAVWTAFPQELVAQAGLNFRTDPDSNWAYLQTAYGLIRRFGGGADLAWMIQGLVTLGSAVIVWFTWRSRICYALKAAILSTAALLATPYAFAYDGAAIVIPAAFLATDQLNRGFLRGEKAMWIILFGVPFAVLVTLGDNAGGTTFGGTPVCLFAAFLLFCVILRRALRSFGDPTIINDGTGLQPAAFR
ncbi:MAG: glycosyltransferase family 87 protein [Stellaceae bacterium]